MLGALAAGAGPLDLLCRLVDKSLVLVGRRGDDVRYSMLETIGQYASEKLEGSGEEESVRSRHADFFLRLAEKAAPDLSGPDQGEWIDRLDAEVGNLRAAMAWFQGAEDTEGELRLASALWGFCHARGYYEMGRAWLEEALSKGGDPTPLRAGALTGAGCLEGTRGDVTIQPLGPVELMTVDVENLPPNTEFNLFILQLPREPFGVAWYQGDIKTNAQGDGKGIFVGRFNRQTFAMAPDSGTAPVIHEDGPYPDASTNPEFGPIHTYHLGLFFDSPRAAEWAGCPDDVTPFNGRHRAGIKALSTRQFADDRGPLREVAP